MQTFRDEAESDDSTIPWNQSAKRHYERLLQVKCAYKTLRYSWNSVSVEVISYKHLCGSMRIAY